MRLGKVDWLLAYAVSAPVVVLFAFIPGNILSPLLRELPVGWYVLGLALVACATVAVALVIARVRTPRVDVDVVGKRLRAGRATVSWSDIDAAELISLESKRKRTLILVLHSGTSLKAPVLLRRANGQALDERTQNITAQIVRESTIAMPSSKDDPTGRFARFNFPTNITKDEALDLVIDPPEFGQPIPIPAQR